MEIVQIKSRDTYADILRVVCAFAVVMLHSSAYRMYIDSIDSIGWFMMNFYNSLTRFAVPCFFMLSGSLFLNPNKPFNIGKLYNKNIMKLCVAFVCWSVLYALYRCYVYKIDVWSVSTLCVVLQGNYHMWFVYAMILLYMATPILRKIVTDEKTVLYFLLFSLIFSIIIPSLRVALEYNVIQIILDKMNPLFFMGNTFYFVLGYYLSSHTLKKSTCRMIYILGILGLLITILATYGLSLIYNELTVLHDPSCFNVMLWTVAVFVFFKRCFEKYAFKEKTVKFWKWLSSLCFGIYLVHALILDVFIQLDITTALFSPYVASPLIAIIAYVISLIIAYGISKIPVVNKYLI